MKFNDAQTTILDFFSDSHVRNTKSVWEKSQDGNSWKWVLTLHNLNWGDTVIIFTKFILKTDSTKAELLNQQFSYLYDLNCKYRYVNFKDEQDLHNKLHTIVLKAQFGEDIQKLSHFIENPTMRLNDELAKQGITDYTVFDLSYTPKINVVPCKLAAFDFQFDINNVYQIELNIRKENNSNYVFHFKLDDETNSVEVSDLSRIEEIIIQYIKEETKIKS